MAGVLWGATRRAGAGSHRQAAGSLNDGGTSAGTPAGSRWQADQQLPPGPGPDGAEPAAGRGAPPAQGRAPGAPAAGDSDPDAARAATAC